MADKTEPDPQQQQNNPPAGDDDKQKSFWDQLGEFMDKRIDAAFERHDQKQRPVGQSRNADRKGVPDIIADFMFGPKKE